MRQHIDQERITEQFLKLVEIDNPSLAERKMADEVRHQLDELGVFYTEDETWRETGGNAGNIFATVPGTLPGGAVLLSAHLDSVAPAVGKRGILHEDGTITSAGDTVLGSDDLAGVAEILELVRCLKEQQIPHRPLELWFTYGEELYSIGGARFDFTQIRAEEAYVLDATGAPGVFLYKAPTILSFEIRVRGKASHAGFAPERGIHAIRICAEAISQVKIGHLDEETTVNIGEISGGAGTNIVPELCTVRGEIRSYVHEKALEQLERIRGLFQKTAEQVGGSAEFLWRIGCHAYEIRMDSPSVQNFRRVCDERSHPFMPQASFGGSDNNALAEHGIEGIVLSCGMEQVHTTQEYTTVRALTETTEMLVALVTGTMAE